MAKLLGFQIANVSGENIQGDDNDPSGFASFEIMSAETATATIAKYGQESGLLLQPIFEGDIEEPAIV